MEQKTIEIIQKLTKEQLMNYISEFLKVRQSKQKLNKEDESMLMELNRELINKI